MVNTRELKVKTLKATLSLALAAVGPAALAQTYTITNLSAFGNSSQANGLNATGEVVGISNISGTDAAGNQATAGFTYSGSLTQIGTLGGTSSAATGVNAGGQVVGYTQLSTDVAQRAFVAASNGSLVNLGTLAGGTGDTSSSHNSQANGINDSGEVVGFASAGPATGNTVSHAFLYTSGSGLHDLGTLSGGTTSTAAAINAGGVAVGSSTTTANGSVTHAFVWEPSTPNSTTGTLIDIGTLGGAYSNAYAVNVVGQIAGNFTTSAGSIHAFRTATPLASINPVTDDLGTLGGTLSEATGLNTAGTTVGFSTTASGGLSAFVYNTAALGMTDLNSLISPTSGWTLEDATGINDRGQIVGFGLFNGLTRAFLLTPAPEPTPLVALALGVLGVGALAARRRHPGKPTP